MGRLAALLVAGLLAGCAVVDAQRQEGAESVDLIQLDVVVSDKRGRALPDLTQADFTVKDDGHPVEIVTFAGPGEGERGTHRSLVLLLDDVGVPPDGRETIQAIARSILQRLDPRDDAAVVRFSSRFDEAYGDRLLARERIDGYQPGLQPLVVTQAPEEMLLRVSAIAEQMSTKGDGRHVVICIGSPLICNGSEPMATGSRLWFRWVRTLADAARNNLSVYAIVPGRSRFRVGGLPEFTGGRMYSTVTRLEAAVAEILEDARHYYLLGYWPPAGSGKNGLRRLEVKVSRSGASVLVRKRRGV